MGKCQSLRAAPLRRGASIVWGPLVMLLLLGFVALAVDSGHVRVGKQQLQTAADAAALAAAPHVQTSKANAEDAAIEIAGENEVAGQSVTIEANPDNDPGGDIVFGVWDEDDRTFTVDEANANAVQVTARRTNDSPDGALSVFFARVFGRNSVEFSRSAIAMSKGSIGMVLLRGSGKGLHSSGNGRLTVGGSVFVNSNDSQAMTVSGNATVTAPSFEIVGELFGNGNVNGAVNEGVDPTPDPLADLPTPRLGSGGVGDPIIRSPKKMSITKDTTLSPGRYKEGIEISSKANVRFNPGVYIIEGGGLKISGQGTVIMDRVLVYNTGVNDTTSNADQFLVSGNGRLEWTPPDDGPYAGIAYFQNRLVADKKVQVPGNGKLSISGAIYAKAAEVQISGNGDTIGAGIVASSAQISGNGAFNVGAGNFGSKRAALVD